MTRSTPQEITEFSFQATLLPVLRVALEFNVLEAVSQPTALAEIGRRIGATNLDSLDKLLRVLAAAELITPLADGRYVASSNGSACCGAAGRPSIGHYVLAMAQVQETLAKGYAAVLRSETAEPLLPPWASAAGSATAQLHSAAMVGATQEIPLAEVCALLKQYVRPDAANRVLDLGSGLGVYALAIAEAFPRAAVVLFDRAVVIDAARSYLAGRHGAERLSLVTGDLRTGPYPGGCDLVFASHSICCELSNLDGIVRQAAEALNPGGWFAIRYFEQRPTQCDHSLSVLHGDLLNHALYGYGQVIERKVLDDALCRAGFVDLAHHDEATSQTLMARRPI